MVCKATAWGAKGVEPDQMLHSAASDLGQHCLLQHASNSLPHLSLNFNMCILLSVDMSKKKSIEDA